MRYAIVTGANYPSIGFRTAQMLAGAPHHFTVILACRDEEKGRASAAEIILQNLRARVMVIPLDLASAKSVHDFVAAFNQLPHLVRGRQPRPHFRSPPPLHLLVLNAGVGFGRHTIRSETVEGHEKIMGVNYLGHFLLANLLLPHLKKAAAAGTPQQQQQPAPPPASLAVAGIARVVVVASSLHDPRPSNAKGKRPRPRYRGGDTDAPTPSLLGDIDQLAHEEQQFDAAMTYKRSTLCNVMMAYELHRRLAAEARASSDEKEKDEALGIAVNAVNPGFIPATGLIRDSGCLSRCFLRWCLDGCVAYLCRGTTWCPTRTVHEGAVACTLTATHPLASTGGEYFELDANGEFFAQRSSEESYSVSQAEALWEHSLRLVGLDVADGSSDAGGPVTQQQRQKRQPKK